MGISGAFRLSDLDLKRRSNEPELLDAEVLNDATVAQAYRELCGVHRWLGNTRAILNRLRREPRNATVLDVGCGQGALLVEIRDRLGLSVVGMDLRPAPVESPVPILTGNAVTDPLPRADVAVCLVMAHHLTEAELAGLVANVSRSCRRFILLDLVRHPVPLALFRLFVAPWLGRVNALDGQTSIRRAFTPPEMRAIVDSALAGCQRPVTSLRHTVSPLWMRQVIDVSWEHPT